MCRNHFLLAAALCLLFRLFNVGVIVDKDKEEQENDNAVVHVLEILLKDGVGEWQDEVDCHQILVQIFNAVDGPIPGLL